MSTPAVVQHLNPPDLNRNPAFTNVVVVTAPVKTIYVGGQNAVDSSGAIIGRGDFRKQAEQVLRNLQAALAAAGAELQHVIKWNIFVVHGQDARTGLAVFQEAWGDRPNPPAISVLFVAGLAHPEFLLEIDAIAVLPT